VNGSPFSVIRNCRLVRDADANASDNSRCIGITSAVPVFSCRTAIKSPVTWEELDLLESRYELFKIEFFQEYKWCVGLTAGVACVLAIFLVMIAAWAEATIERDWDWFLGAAIVLSFAPAPVTLAWLWLAASLRVRPLESDTENLEQRAVRAVL
jgi:hypothetical protein